MNVQPSCCLDVEIYMLNCVFWRHILLEIEFKSSCVARPLHQGGGGCSHVSFTFYRRVAFYWSIYRPFSINLRTERVLSIFFLFYPGFADESPKTGGVDRTPQPPPPPLATPLFKSRVDMGSDSNRYTAQRYHP